MPDPSGVRVVLVGGHESAEGADLHRLRARSPGWVTSAQGRALNDVITASLGGGDTVVVVPMTFGRDPAMVAHTARTMLWLARTSPGRLALAAPFGQADHLTAWIRAAANRIPTGDRVAAALLVVARHSNPFDEAELHRLAYLAAAHGAGVEVLAAIADTSEELERTVARARATGASEVYAVPAGLASTVPRSSAVPLGPLMTEAAIARVVRVRTNAALDALRHGDDGIGAGLMADHDHGYAHSHALEGDQPHSHGTHSHGARPHHHHDHHQAPHQGHDRSDAPPALADHH